MHTRLGRTLLPWLLVCALGAFALADSESHARIVRLSYVDGQVQMDRDGSRGLETAFLNMPLAQGSRVVTGGDGYSEIEFENGGTIRLAPGSDMLVRELGARGDSRVTMVDFSSGVGYFNIKGDSDDDFRVLVQGQELRVVKSARFRVRLARDSAQIAVMKGEVQVTGENDVRVKRDETLTLDFQDRGRYFLSRSIETLTYDAWDRERDDYRERYASNRYGSGRYAYGASDLNYYGTYINVAGYGDCWRPYGFGASWDPFSDGAWVWYPRWGYVWVSSYPWGWTPYRHGRWIWVTGHNWCWQPGSAWSSWYYYPVIYQRPQWYGWDRCHPPRRGRDGHGGGGIVVVGRGPYRGDHGPGRRLHQADGTAPGRGNDRTVVVGGTAGAGGGGGGGGGNLRGPGRPSGLTPGVVPDEQVVEQLRRVHGQDLGVRGRRVIEEADLATGDAATGGARGGNTGGVSATGGSSDAAAAGNSGGADGPGAGRGSNAGNATPTNVGPTGRDDDAVRRQQPRTAPQPMTQPAQAPAAPAAPASAATGPASSGGSGRSSSSGSSSAGSSGSYSGGGSRGSSGASSGGGYSGGSSSSSGSSSGGSSSSGSSSSGSSSSGGGRSSGGSSSSGSSSSSHSSERSPKNPK